MKGDLDWIVMKALEKDRSRRYDTASAFAADVRRFLAEEPIEARPPSAWYRFRKMARRNKVALATTGIVAAALILGTALSLWQAVRATQAEHDAVVQRDDATEQRNEAAKKRQEAGTARQQLRRTLYAAHLNLAHASWEGGRIGEVLQLLDREKAASPDLCGFEWHYWRRQCATELTTLKLPDLSSAAAFSPDGKSVVTASGDQTARLWDSATGKPLGPPLQHQGQVFAAAFSPDGKNVVTASSDKTFFGYITPFFPISNASLLLVCCCVRLCLRKTPILTASSRTYEGSEAGEGQQGVRR